MKNNIALEFYLNSTPNDRLDFLRMIAGDIIIPVIIDGGVSQENLWEENPICLNGTAFQLNTEEFGNIIDAEEKYDDDSVLNKPIEWLFPKTSKNQSPTLSSRVCTALGWRVHYDNGNPINTIGDLVEYDRFQILLWKHIGKKSLAFIQESLAKHGLYLRGENK